MDVVVSDFSEDGVDSGESEGATVLGEATIRLVGDRVLTQRNALVCQRLGGLLNVRNEKYFW